MYTPIELVKKYKIHLRYQAELKKDYEKFNRDMEKYTQLNKDERFAVGELSPILTDYKEKAGNIGGYFYQDLWGAKRILADIKPGEMHYDIASRIDGFIAHLLCGGVEVSLIDIRPLDLDYPGLHFTQADATNLDGIDDESISSLSALCSLEHFGLGRYNDPIDPEASFKAFHSAQRVTKKGGRVYISVPVGQDRLLFNELRIFNASTVVDAFKPMRLIEYSVMTSHVHESGEVTYTFDWHCPIDRFDDYTKASKTGFFIFEK